MNEADDMFDKFQEECGVFGIWGVEDAAALAALGLHALQHRGQEACGIVTHDGAKFFSHRALGMVDETFNRSDVLSKLPGHCAIAHNRYATTGETWLRNVQPLHADLDSGGFAIAHNGNLTNALTLRKSLVDQGALFQSTSDTEVILHSLIRANPNQSIADRLSEALQKIEGAYALVCLFDGKLIGVRDPMGIRPLVLGRLGNAYVLTSETCALDIIGATYVREVAPGEMVVIDSDGIQSHHNFKNTGHKFCVFEYIYFARPDSSFEGRSVYQSRVAIGAQLAVEAPCTADLVVPVPDSGVPSALGFAQQSGIPFGYGIIRNHYVGRTFIQPTDQIRHLGVKLKHNPNKALIQGKSIVLVDDSIVRGTTSRKIVDMVRAAGATEVHMRIAAPPTKYGCFYGVDTPDAEKLLAHTHSIEQIREFIGVDSLAYISMDGLYGAINDKQERYCDACFSGNYPVDLTDKKAAGCSPNQRLSSLASGA